MAIHIHALAKQKSLPPVNWRWVEEGDGYVGRLQPPGQPLGVGLPSGLQCLVPYPYRWVHAVASCTTPWFLFHPQEAVCSTAHATYNLVAITVTVGHLVLLLVCYWHELQVKLQFLGTRTGGDPQHPGLPHPNSMPLVLTLQLTAGLASLAVAALLATHSALAAG
jgi:hypothetical protein